MTNHTEARLAREAELAYASLSMVTDYDCWHSEHDAVSVEMVIGNLQANAAATEPILHGLMGRLQLQRPGLGCPYGVVHGLDHPEGHGPRRDHDNGWTC